MEDILSSKARIKKIIVKELETVVEKYNKPRRTEIIYAAEEQDETEIEEIPDYPVHLFFTKEGYFKKITPQSLRMSGEQKLKEGDSITQTFEATNSTDLLFFTDRCQVYKAKAADFDDTKASVLGDFETKTNRKKLIKAYCDKFPLAAIYQITEDCELVVQSTAGRILLLNTGAITPKTTKDTQGVSVMTLKKGYRVASVRAYKDGEFKKPARYRTRSLPAAGALLSAEDAGEQLTL